VARRPGTEADRVYEAAGEFVRECLQKDSSVFSPGRPIWSQSVVSDLNKRFVQHPDPSKDTFERKFQRQLAGAGPATVQLAAELLYVHLLISTQLKGPTKIDLISRVLSWSKDSTPIPTSLQQALHRGLCNAGQSFLQHRPFLLIYLVEFMGHWKGLAPAVVAAALRDPWAFKIEAFSVPAPTARIQQHALLHLVHPDTFEAIVSENHKRYIVERFGSTVGISPADDLDRQLLQIRTYLTPTYGPAFSYYDDKLESEWRPKKAEDEGEADSNAIPAGGAGPTYWVEKTLVAGRNDRQQGLHALGRALWSPQKTEDGRDYYRAMREISPGDVVLHFIDNRRFSGISRVSSAPDTSFIGLSGTDWADRPAIRVELADYTTLEPPIEREEFFHAPDVRPHVQEIVATHKGLFFNRNLELNQGSYLTEAPVVLVRLLNKLYRQKTGQNLPHIDTPVMQNASIPTKTTNVLDLAWLAEQTLWPEERLAEIIDALRSSSRQVVLAGPPGTSKTWIAQLLARYLTQDQPDRHRLVQFHPSYSYEAFVEGLRPVADNGLIQFKRVDGVVVDLVARMGNSDGGCQEFRVWGIT
jgi:5-methylcytosine-specific restriction protein B